MSRRLPRRRNRRRGVRTAPAIAAFGQSTIELSNITYTVVECPTGKRSMTQGKPACLLVKADSVNPSKETVYNADVFGRVTDKGGDNALDNDAASDAGRIANIAEVPPGNGTVSFNISVAAQSAELGLNFRGFKARSYREGRSGATRRCWASWRRDATYTRTWSARIGTLGEVIRRGSVLSLTCVVCARRQPKKKMCPVPSSSSTRSFGFGSPHFLNLSAPAPSQRMMRVNEACDASLMDSRFSWNVLNLSSTDANAFSPPSGSTYTTSALSAG